MAAPNTDRDPLEVLAAEYMDRLRQGQRPSIEEYATQHPDLAEEIRELFPTIAVTERLKAQRARSSGGRVSLGATQLTRLGDFRLIREIGRGGMGVVFEAEQESLGRRVAVKVLPRQVLLDEKHLKRFEREARIAANLHHTNIVEVFGVGEHEGFHYYVMQYIDGVGLDAVIPRLAQAVRSLDETKPASPPPAKPEDAKTETAVRHLLGEEGQRIGQLGPAYWQSVARIGLQAAEALDHAHQRGVLHRDMKPANLLLGPQGTIWLTDFGLAKALESQDLSLSKDIVGTLRYMPPEQFQGKTDHRSDIYSLGLTLYELAALRPAYEETDQTRLIQRIAQGAPSALRAASPGIPRDLETIILKAISHDASERYSSAREMAGDLRCFLEDRPIGARRASSMERLGRWCRRNRALASLTGTTLLLLMLVAVVASIGYLRTERALRGEALERTKAEANANLAIQAIDRTFERLYPTRLGVRRQPGVEGLRGEIMPAPNVPVLSKETAALLEEMLSFYDRLAQQTGNSDKLRLRTAEASRRVGAIRQRLGQPKEAVAAYQRSIALFRELSSRSPRTPSLTLSVAQIQNELGRLFTSERQTEEARRSHQAALELLEPDAGGASAPPDARFELARTYFFLGLPERPLPTKTPRQEGGSEPAPVEHRDSLAKAVTLLGAFSASPPVDPEYEHLLALCYLEGATVEDGRTSEAGGGDERAIGILERLVKGSPSFPDYAYDLTEAYMRVPIPQPPVPPEVENRILERFSKALALVDKLASQHPDVPDYLVSEARIHHKLGSIHRQMERWADAEQCFRKAMGIQTLLVNRFPDSPSYRVWMATFRIALADALNRRDEPAEARVELEGTISALLRQVTQWPEMNSLHDLLSLAYAQLEVALRQQGEDALAAEAARKAEQERSFARRAP